MTTSTERRSVRDLERLALEAFVDPLTGLRNRRGLDRDLAQRLALARRGGRELTVVVGDLDGLKEINDREGHAAGDLALRALGAALESGLRAGDTAFRIGGDEFLLLLADTGAEEAEAVVGRVRTAAPPFSWGAATFPIDGDDGPSLVELADQRLLSGRRRARRGGERRDGIRPTSHGGVGALAVAALTVVALLGGVGVGFAAQTVMDSEERFTAAAVGNPPTGARGSEPATEQPDAIVKSFAPAVATGSASPATAQTTAPTVTAATITDQIGAAITIPPTPVDEVAQLIEDETGQLIETPSTDPAEVLGVVEEAVDEVADELEPEQESGEGTDGRKPGAGPKHSR